VIRARALALAAALLLRGLAPGPAHAYFDQLLVGARQTALGVSGHADATDASAWYWNPAGLAGLPGAQAMVDYAKPYGIPDLNEGSLAVAFPVRAIGLAAAWHRTGINEVYSEDQFAIAAGRRLWSHPAGHRVSAGASAKIDRIAFTPFSVEDTGEAVDYGSQTAFSFDLAAEWETPWSIDLAWIGRDLPEPTFAFIEGSPGGQVPFRQDLALAWHWNPESVVTGVYTLPGDGRPGLVNLGLEIRFYRVFAIRSGFTNTTPIARSAGDPRTFDYTGGFGVAYKGYQVDASAVSSHELGASYRVTLLVPFGRGVPR
jgi:hypothetical protein